MPVETATLERLVYTRVATGAAWLDTNRPGWWHTIDTGRLDIASRRDCVLGQTYGDYHLSPWAARFDPRVNRYVAGERGFNINPFVTWDGADCYNRELDLLNCLWRQLIQGRRAQEPQLS